MGELDEKPFCAACKQKGISEIKAAESISEWQEHLKDPNWHPFKITKVEGTEKVCLSSSFSHFTSVIFYIVMTRLVLLAFFFSFPLCFK